MTSKDIVLHRLLNQQLADSKFENPEDIVSRMGALQAQDFPMARWAVGIRLPGSDESDVLKAIAGGKIIRTHILRPTWHFVSSEDIYWMLELTAPNILRSMRSRHRELELTSKLLNKIHTLFEKELMDKELLTRKELVSVLIKNKISLDNNRAAHILMYAELTGLLCSGEVVNNQHTYAVFHQKVKIRSKLSREEALAELASRYFNTRSPATVQDFTWWSGLTAKDARIAVELIRPQLSSERISNIDYFFVGDPVPIKNTPNVILLPAYDEFVISYKERSHLLNFDGYKNVISAGGLFRPVVLINGEAAGIWKRSRDKNDVIIDISLFQHPDERTKKHIDIAAEKYGRFLNKVVRLKYSK